DQDFSGVENRLVDRYQNIGKDRAHHEVDVVALETATIFLNCDIRFELVISYKELHLFAAHLAAKIFQGEFETVFRLLAERGGRARQGVYETNANLVLGCRRVDDEYKCGSSR